MDIEESLLGEAWDVVVKIGGADPRMRSEFVRLARHSPGPFEFRFVGCLGFGGKIFVESHCGFRASCYREDETLSRTKCLARINRELSLLSERLDLPLR